VSEGGLSHIRHARRSGIWRRDEAFFHPDREGARVAEITRRRCVLPDHPRLVPDWYHRVMALTVRTDEQMEQALDALVETEGVSRQEVIRRSILDRYERTVHARRVAERTSQLSARWGDVLDRLGRS